MKNELERVMEWRKDGVPLSEIARRLKKAGGESVPRGLVTALISGNPSQTNRVETGAPVYIAIASTLDDLGVPHSDIAALLHHDGYQAWEIARALRHGCLTPLQDIAVILSCTLLLSREMIARALHDGLHLSAPTTARALRDGLRICNAGVASTLAYTLCLSAPSVVKALYARSGLNLGADAVDDAVRRGLGFGDAETADVFRRAGITEDKNED